MSVYTLSEELIDSKPEIRIGDKIYKVDDRKKTVDKISKINDNSPEDADGEMIKLALGEKAAKEIEEMNLPFPAYAKLLTLIGAAISGEKPEEVEARFQEAKAAN